MSRVVQAISKGTSYTSRTTTALQQPAALHVTSRSGLATTLSDLRTVLSGLGAPTGTHIILGVDLPNCGLFLEDITSHWYQASYNVVSLHEMIILFVFFLDELLIAVIFWALYQRV